MWRRRAGLISIGLWIGLAASPALAGDYAKTCRYFDAIAFNDNALGKTGSFRAVLASDCHAARRAIREAAGTEGALLADRYLKTLTAYRAALLGIAQERFGKTPVIAGPNTPRGTHRYIARPVSRTGAYLIAKSMGLVAHQRAWATWQIASAR